MQSPGRSVSRRPEDQYVGEKKNQLRHGHGVYHYDNKFFKYEGQWENGLKHGHGKLTLGDSGYYEGSFQHGEIEGHGYKVFGISGASYTGQFHLGEMHGQGLMRHPNGEQYEGSWYQGKKQGNGILTCSDGSIYEGSFHQNLRHGEGLQIYSNGDQYDGDWVAGKRHGSGMLRCADGTIYDGQWRGDMFHGEGKISHASGVSYSGIWSHDKPAEMPVALRLTGKAEVVIIEQGKAFDINFECINEDGTIATLESGRTFKIEASMRKVMINKSRSRICLTPTTTNQSKFSPSATRSDLISKNTSQLIQTPFGYSCTPYELLQAPPPKVKSATSSSSTGPDDSAAGSLHKVSSRKMVTFDSSKSSSKETAPLIKISRSDPLQSSTAVIRIPPCKSESQISLDDAAISKIIVKESMDDELRSTSSSNIELHSSSQVIQGHIGTHSPLAGIPQTKSAVISGSTDEEDKTFDPSDAQFLESLVTPSLATSKVGNAVFKDLFLPPPPPPPDLSHILTPSPTTKSLLDSASKASLKSTSSSRSTTPATTSKSSSSSLTGKKLRKTPSQNSIKKDKLLLPKREKYCLPGTYVFIISEVTNPPFIGGKVSDLFIEAIVTSHKITSKETTLERLLLQNKVSKKSKAKAKGRPA